MIENLEKVCCFPAHPALPISAPTFIMEKHCDDALAPGSFQHLMERLEALDHDPPREPLAGIAFFVSPTEYLTILQSERPLPSPSDYSCDILYFKSKTS